MSEMLVRRDIPEPETVGQIRPPEPPRSTVVHVPPAICDDGADPAFPIPEMDIAGENRPEAEMLP